MKNNLAPPPSSPPAFAPSFADAVHYVERSNFHTTFGALHPPVAIVQPGQLVHVETWDCYHGKICPSHPSPEHLQRQDLNPVTGPLYIQGAAPGDVLSVTLHDIRPTTMGVAMWVALETDRDLVRVHMMSLVPAVAVRVTVEPVVMDLILLQEVALTTVAPTVLQKWAAGELATMDRTKVVTVVGGFASSFKVI